MFDPLRLLLIAPSLAVILSAGVSASVANGAPESSTESSPSFLVDVVPILTRYGCNGGGCHGKATGQNGFRLSLLGFEPDFDHVALLREGRGRRVFPGSPDSSLLLSKAAGQVPHGGGTRIQIGSEDYRVLRDWIQAGAPGPRPEEPTLVRVSVSPDRQIVEPNSTLQLKVVAHFSDGRSRDVTDRALFETNLPELAEVNETGELTTNTRGGLFAAMVRFGGTVGVFLGTVPFRGTTIDVQSAVIPETTNTAVRDAASSVNRLLVDQWNRLGVEPSAPADDFEFIRRATIDICGTLPTAEEVTLFSNDKGADKRVRLLDGLLERPSHASWFALKWAAILQNRGRGYSTGKQREGTALFTAWIRDSIAENKPYDRFVTEILTATGSQERVPPAIWYRSVRTTKDYVESIAQSFLGVRIQCAQCHRHPAERWTQADYYSLAAVFARVGRKGGFSDAEVPTSEVLYLKDRGEVTHPRTGEVMTPRPLGGPDFQLSKYDDPRRALAKWMTEKDNPFFARTMVNRMWGHFLQRGIIHPIDDSRSTNPPSNPELLDTLARDFAESGYDVRHLIRVITNSQAYGLNSAPNESNREDLQSYSRFYPRRLPAEVLLDGISQVLAVPTVFPGGPGTFPVGTRAIDLPDENVTSTFLDVFGRPARTTACECERSDEPALAQALELVNSSEIQRKLAHDDGYVARLGGNEESHSNNTVDIFLRVFARKPSSAETETAVDFLKSETDRGEAYRSLVWSLLATNEFMFNH
ncbi:MAG: DUF1553 domain-containing protein [Planctomycetota bacterium]|nr:DUF1553 domain-containing protein [Planctomycetota bacterium]